MRHKKTLFFLSPIPWVFHNRQIPLFAQQLSKKYNVVYFGNYRNSSVGIIRQFLDNKFRSAYLNFLKRLAGDKYSLVSKPIILDSIPLKLQLSLISLISSHSFNYIVWCTTSSFDQYWKLVKNHLWIYDFFDRYPDNSEETKNNETWLINNSRIVFVSSVYYKKYGVSKLGKNNKKVIETPIGYDLNNYLKVSPKKKNTNILIGYQGGISDRLDFELIIQSVRKNPDFNFLFVGPLYLKSQHALNNPYDSYEFLEKLRSFSNVKIISFIKDTKKLARLMAGFDIGWIPYNTKVAFNKYATPNKFYEYTAVGLPVISTHLKVLSGYPTFVNFIQNSGDLRAAVQKILDNNNMNLIRLRKQFAGNSNIDKKYKKVIDILTQFD